MKLQATPKNDPPTLWEIANANGGGYRGYVEGKFNAKGEPLFVAVGPHMVAGERTQASEHPNFKSAVEALR